MIPDYQIDNSNIQRINGNSGFSLIETLLAVAILSIGMLATGALVVGIINGNSVAKHITIATTLAQDKMEELRQSGYSGLSSIDSTTTEDYDSIVNAGNGSSTEYANYRRVTDVDVDAPDGGMKTVTISVHWRSGTNPASLKTIFAE
jgi:type IV pilus assembly protein PilV